MDNDESLRAQTQLNDVILENGVLSQKCAALAAILEQKTAELAVAKAKIERQREQSDAES